MYLERPASRAESHQQSLHMYIEKNRSAPWTDAAEAYVEYFTFDAWAVKSSHSPSVRRDDPINPS